METQTTTAPISKKILWLSYLMSTLPVLLLLMSAVMKFTQPPQAVEGMKHLGYPQHLALGIGIVELICTVLYVIPRTSVLGAILLTGYLGGATSTHLRVGDPFISPVIFGVILWGGLYLRDRRIRALIPFKG
jgi:uncharacterized membrane protein YphA (DoxX/SURF4 family)